MEIITIIKNQKIIIKLNKFNEDELFNYVNTFNLKNSFIENLIEYSIYKTIQILLNYDTIFNDFYDNYIIKFNEIEKKDNLKYNIFIDLFYYENIKSINKHIIFKEINNNLIDIYRMSIKNNSELTLINTIDYNFYNLLLHKIENTNNYMFVIV